MEMDRQVCRLAQRLEQSARRGRLQQPGHVLDRDDVSAGLFQLAGHADIVVQIILGAVGIEDVAGIADGRFAELALAAHRIHGHAHVIDPVEAVEDAEQIDAAGRRLPDEVPDHIVGIVGVANAVGAAQKHLQKQVRRALAHQRQPFPRIFRQEAHRDVKRRAAPAFERQELRQRARIDAGDPGDVLRAHPRRQKRLVRVTHRRVGDEHAILLPHPACELVRADRVETLFRAIRHRCVDIGYARGGRLRIGQRTSARLGMAIDGDVGQIVEQLGRAVAPLDLREQLRRLVDEPRRVAVVAELRMANDRLEEGQVGRHAADTELAQRAIHPADRLFRRGSPGGHLFQKRIVEAGDHRTGIGSAAVEADAEAGGAAVGGDAAIVRDEVLFRILGGNAALQGIAVEADVLLRRHA